MMFQIHVKVKSCIMLVLLCTCMCVQAMNFTGAELVHYGYYLYEMDDKVSGAYVLPEGENSTALEKISYGITTVGLVSLAGLVIRWMVTVPYDNVDGGLR